MQFNLINGPPDATAPKSPLSEPFTLTALPDTDVWRTPASAGGRDSFDGTILATELPLKSFQRAQVTVSADWKSQYAQAGLIFYDPSSHRPWIKAGIEFKDGATFASVVAANPYSDWSLLPWGEKSVTIEFEKVHGALWVYGRKAEGEKIPMRETTWAFENEDANIAVGVLVAMPKGEDGVENGGQLDVRFENFTIETA
ncbi:hypothetical protein P152DRAFT_454724 [Eremomyces bilateralis CBS 781.70]|uniref:DUF1349-domain-containing protein n=1 Tax=Eremomyces bilateralis CBS 781.70 TaxID=1392243 RepID=A0A6G1GF08_9PEZI|nr:uncharacterized protein P152DRAFT_454724 [Eremomyces bilateralis CBS 781.70]KAF1816459.1 hypothetical protein P152DRAFT_454724 [Eremomyces bilateralis CBS 781.70]